MGNDQRPRRWPPGEQYGQLLRFLDRLDAGRLHYVLRHTRPDSLMVDVQIPGERWEIEFMLDGSLEVERYRSSGEIEGEPALLDELLRSGE
jgi:hypothetical protein